MATSSFSHEGYTGSIEVSQEDECLHGRILFITDIVTYEAETVPQLKVAFEAAVQRYIRHCRATEKEPNRPFSGTFNVRIGAENHRACAVAAHQAGIGLNEFVLRAVETALKREPMEVRHTHEHKHNHYVKVTNVETVRVLASTESGQGRTAHVH